jgi:polyhydroxybutyrate depolymerase
MKKLFLFLMLIAILKFNVFSQKYYQIRWQNLPRNYIVYLPVNFAASENLPLVINMHGFTNTAKFQMDYSQFNKTADSARCIVIYPEGVDKRWNSGTFFFVSSTVDDVGFLSDLMDRAAVLYNADMKKVYSTGYSAGGFMSYKLACNATNRIAAIAPDVASMVNDNLSSCVPSRPVNIAAFNGLSDPITPYAGFPGNFPGIDSIRHFWQIKNACDIAPVIDTMPDLQNDGTRVVRYTYQNCSQNTEQVYYKIINGGHVWPGAANIYFGILGKTTQDISMNNVAWDFFKSKEIPPAVRCDAPSNLQSTAITADSFLVSWTAVSGVLKYKIAIADDSDRITFYETTNTTFGVKINNPVRQNRWNVASLCNSGYHNWNTTRLLNNIITSVRSNVAQYIKLFPNPANDYIHLELPGIISNSEISVYNLPGEKVIETKSNSKEIKLDISKLEKGWYLLSVINGIENYTSSFVKE